MNSFSLNAAALNAHPPESTVFAVIEGGVRALGVSTARRRAFSAPMQATCALEAQAQAKVWGRAKTAGGLSAWGRAQALRLAHVPVHGVVRTPGQVAIYLKRGMRMEGVLQVGSKAPMYVRARRAVAMTALARVQGGSMAGVRRSAQTTGSVWLQGQAQGQSVPRRQVRQWVQGTLGVGAEQVQGPRVRRHIRQMLWLQVRGRIQAGTLRGAASAGALQVQGELHDGVINPIAPFHEHAPQERSFIVPFGAAVWEVN